MSIFNIFKRAAPAPEPAPVFENIPPMPPEPAPAPRKVGTVRFCPVFDTGTCGAPHRTFYSASQQTGNVARIMRLELDPNTLGIISVVMLHKHSAHEIGVNYGL